MSAMNWTVCERGPGVYEIQFRFWENVTAHFGIPSVGILADTRDNTMLLYGDCMCGDTAALRQYKALCRWLGFTKRNGWVER